MSRRVPRAVSAVALALAWAAAVPPATAQVVNGDFSAGFSGFTSDYLFATSSTEADIFGVRTDPKLFNLNYDSFGDHTTGTGNMMVVNGALVANQTVWSQTIPVAPGASYQFSGWVASAFSGNSAMLVLLANGTQLGAVVVAPTASGNWVNFNRTWNTGAATTTVLRIVDLNTDQSGNDFVLDDFSVVPVPEPTALALAAAAAMGGWVCARYRRGRAQRER
jgi:PEP-CTERM motif